MKRGCAFRGLLPLSPLRLRGEPLLAGLSRGCVCPLSSECAPLPSGAVSGAPRHLLRYMLHGKLLCLRIVSYRPLSSRLFHLGSVSQQVPSYLPVRVAVLQGRLRPRALALAVKKVFSPSLFVSPVGDAPGPSIVRFIWNCSQQRKKK